MDVKITYPPAGRRRRARQALMLGCKWTFRFAGLLCAVVNAATGGKAWSVVVIVSMWLVWTLLVSPDLVEYNRISQTIKLIVHACILLFCIDLLLAPGWAMEVVPIVGYCALLLAAILFFTDFETQRQNLFPLLFFSAVCLVGAVLGLLLRRTAEPWPLAVLGAIALSVLIGCAARLGGAFRRECRKYFSTK